MSKQHEFALYAGDTFVSVGTAKELAKELEVKPNTIRFLSTPSYQRRMASRKKPTGRAKYTVKLGLPDEEGV